MIQPTRTSDDPTKEDQAIEIGTAVLYLMAVPALLLLARGDARFFLSAALVTSLLAARELDLHKAFTSGSVLKLSYYAQADAPWSERAMAAVIMVFLIVFLIRFVAKYWKRLLTGLRHRHAPAWSIANAIILLSVTKLLLDARDRLSESLGIAIPRAAQTIFIPLEEVMELVVSVIILWAILQYVVMRRYPME